MRDSSRGAAGCDAASEDLDALVALGGAMVLSVRGGLQRDDGWLKGIGCASSLERGAAAAMCYEGGEGAFFAKL
jgi:hypothetical protein